MGPAGRTQKNMLFFVERVLPAGQCCRHRSRRVARMLRVWRTHHPYADFFYIFLLPRFLIAHATNIKTQMKKNEPSGLLFTFSLLSILGKSGLKVTSLCREATRCKHRYRAREPSRSTSTQLQATGIGSTFCAPQPSH